MEISIEDLEVQGFDIVNLSFNIFHTIDPTFEFRRLPFVPSQRFQSTGR